LQEVFRTVPYFGQTPECRPANCPLKKCATGFASAFLNRRMQAIQHWQSQWHTSD
jgi:hypothetical protein